MYKPWVMMARVWFVRFQIANKNQLLVANGKQIYLGKSFMYLYHNFWAKLLNSGCSEAPVAVILIQTFLTKMSTFSFCMIKLV